MYYTALRKKYKLGNKKSVNVVLERCSFVVDSEENLKKSKIGKKGISHVS